MRGERVPGGWFRSATVAAILKLVQMRPPMRSDRPSMMIGLIPEARNGDAAETPAIPAPMIRTSAVVDAARCARQEGQGPP